MTRLKSSVSPGFIQAAIVLMGLFIVAFIWLLDHQQHRAARTEALESKSAEHLNLATIIAEHLNQLADRSKAVSQVFLAENIALASEQNNLSRALAKDPIFKRLSLYTPQGRWIYNSHDTLPAILPEHWLEQVRHQVARHGFRPFLPTGDSSGPNAVAPKWHMPILLPVPGTKDKDQLSHIMLIELEITETAILDREQLAIQHLEKLKKAGLEISLDDFGLGYAGFAHLYSLPISKLKIDRGLIAQLSNVHDDSPIVSSTIALAKRLSLQVVAEGVETREQLVYLKTSGCDFGQGYHFSRPVAADKIPEFLETFNAMQPATALSDAATLMAATPPASTRKPEPKPATEPA
ncbi:EAL domain-containing protein [Neopusillimonas aromaticivorans]|uniref:EAL domain-containing protein n=1 Tax=Neopusillimonas aromaticivorans TaxID=2979868 RepID=UPI002596EDDF|nr:EAL domain-containing protein [Neopusillimonas aromaticivorans]WJJ93597.1 EAL domain-containing protein [Neopusillimonas aromaticivorans]